MDILLNKRLQIVKQRFGIIVSAADTQTYNSFLKPIGPEPKNPDEKELWKKRSDNHPFWKDFSERYDATVKVYQKARSSDDMAEIIALLIALRDYLEAEANKPYVDSHFITRADGNLDIMAIGRNQHIDKFFEDRVLVVIRKSIDDLESIKAVNPSDERTRHQSNTKPTPEPTVTPDELQPMLIIFPPMQTRLLKSLSTYVPADQHDTLELLLDKGFSANRVWVKLQAGAIGYIFKQAITATTSKVLANNNEVAAWLAAYIDWGKHIPRPISAVTMEKVFRGNTSVSKTNQKPLKH